MNFQSGRQGLLAIAVILCSCEGNSPCKNATEQPIINNYDITKDEDIIDDGTPTYTERETQIDNSTVPIEYYNSVSDYSVEYNNSTNDVITCSNCGGTGICTGCGGSRTMTSEAYYTDGHTIISDCPICNGSGKCNTCYGTGTL